MLRVPFSLLALLWLLPPGVLAAGPELVLVASSQSPVTLMTATEARRLFLGLPVRAGGQFLKALRNTADEELTEVFMQRVMFMGSQAYGRQIRARANRGDSALPPAYGTLPALTAALGQDVFAISYMDRSQARNAMGLKIVGSP